MSLNEEVKAYKSWCDKMGRNPGRAESLDEYVSEKKAGERRAKMKLRDFLKGQYQVGTGTKFILGRFVLVGSYSGKTRYDSAWNSEWILNKYLDLEVERLSSEIIINNCDDSFAQSAIDIFIPDYDIAKEEKAKHKEK